MPAFTNASNVRMYAGVMAIDAQDDRWNEGPLGSNIRAASAFLQKRTGRQFEPQLNTTKVFTTNGEAFIALPGARGNSPTIVLSGTTMTLDTDAWLIPDTQQTGLYIGMQFRPFGRRADHRSFPDWFDTNKDSWRWPGRWGGSDPNDLSITDDWGPTSYPEELVHVTNVLSAWFTRRPDSLLGGVSVTPGGTEIDMGSLPDEVRLFIEEWKIGNAVVSVG